MPHTYNPSIVYHGLGYVGLTGAVHFADTYVDVLGYDPDPLVVQAINAGAPRAGDFLEYLGNVNYLDHFQATSVLDDAVLGIKTHIIAVPSEKNGEPWMPIVFGCLQQLFAGVPAGALILVESTLQPGAIDLFLGQNPAAKQRLDDGEVFLAVCPRRDWFADPDKNLTTIDRIIGGYTEEATRRAIAVYELVTQRHLLRTTTYRTAELTKALENALLHLPVMLCHELAAVYPTLDVADAAKLACTHWRFDSIGPIYLGYGSGGRCVPLGPKYLLQGSPRRETSHLLEKSIAVDRAFPALIADVAFRRGKEVTKEQAPRCLVMGIAYRPGFRDAGLSPGLRVVNVLHQFGAVVSIHDAVFTADELTSLVPKGVAVVPDINPDDYDVILLSTPHKEYLDLPAQWIKAPIVIDGRGTWRPYANRFSSYVQVGAADWSRPF